MPRDLLEPVYRLISSCSYLEAIHHINKLLKKQPNYLIAKIWKCEALHGLGNIAESEELMSSIIEQSPSDRRTVESIADFFRARGNYNKLIEVYENALRQDPSDENWRQALFECCGLACDYKKQHLQALQLYKQNPQMLFYCMAVVCLLQQADENPVALVLAERMMVKQMESGKLKSQNEILLHITVLEKREKFEEALEILNKYESELETLISTSDKKIELLSKLDRLEEVIKLLKLTLREKPDDWTHLKRYIDTAMKLEATGGAADTPDIDDSFDKVRTFLLTLCGDNSKLRGPYLAVLELVKNYSKDASCSQLLDLVADYFQKFGEKAISVFDLSQYVTSIPEPKIPDLLARLSVPEYASLDPVVLQETMGTLKHISYLQLTRFLGLHSSLSNQERERFCESLNECYQKANACERSEYYVLFLAQERIALFSECGDAKHLVLAAEALEDAQTKTPIFAVQVLLLQVYFALGATKSSKKLYEQLRIQSVQVDTLVHLFLYSISSTGHFTIASEMWENASKILHQCSAECLLALVWCYRAGLFHRVEEFASCARRFQKTITIPLLRCEKTYLDILTGEPSRAEQILGRLRPIVQWNSCIDNRDLKGLPSWDPPTYHRPREQSYEELVLYCKVRENTLICLSTAISYGKSRLEQDGLAFNSAIDELQTLYSKAAVKSSSQYYLLTSCSTRLHLILQVPLPAMLEKVMENDLSSSEKICTLLKKSTDNCIEIAGMNETRNPRLSMEWIVTQIESLAVLTVAVGAARQKLSTQARRRSTHVIEAITACYRSLDDACSSYTFVISSSKDTVQAALLENYQVAIDEIRKVIKKKVIYLHKIIVN